MTCEDEETLDFEAHIAEQLFREALVIGIKIERVPARVGPARGVSKDSYPVGWFDEINPQAVLQFSRGDALGVTSGKHARLIKTKNGNVVFVTPKQTAEFLKDPIYKITLDAGDDKIWKILRTYVEGKNGVFGSQEKRKLLQKNVNWTNLYAEEKDVPLLVAYFDDWLNKVKEFQKTEKKK